VTDGRTDGGTDIPPLAIPAVCIACYANALVKIKRVSKNYGNFTFVELRDELHSSNAYLLKIATNRIHYSDCPEVQLTKKIQLI